MKKIVLSIMTMILGLSLSSYAQPQKGGEKRSPEQQATQTVERLNNELKLTPQQQKQLKDYYVSSFKKRHENMEKNRDDREAMRENMMNMREENDKQLEKTLTPDQYKKYKANEEKRRKEMQQKGRSGGGKMRR